MSDFKFKFESGNIEIWKLSLKSLKGMKLKSFIIKNGQNYMNYHDSKSKKCINILVLE